MSASATDLVARCLDVVERTLDRRRPGWAEDPALVASARRLSEGFTADEARSTPPLDDLTEAAYLAYFVPRTVAAVAEVIAPAPPTGRVADLGAGTGAASLVLAAAGAEQLLLLDRDTRALDAAQTMINDLAPTVRADVRAADLAQGAPATSANTLVAAFVLSELSDDPVDAWRRVRAAAASAERFVLLDAGDRRRARVLQEVRDVAIADGWHIHGPCAHEDLCPALERKRDWCHARAPRHLPPSFAHFAEATGRDPEFLAFSWLDIQREPAPHAKGSARVVGSALTEKGRVRLSVCGADGLRFVQALKRHKGAYRGLQGVPRGALLDVGPLEVRGNTAHCGDDSPLVVLDEAAL